MYHDEQIIFMLTFPFLSFYKTQDALNGLNPCEISPNKGSYLVPNPMQHCLAVKAKPINS